MQSSLSAIEEAREFLRPLIEKISSRDHATLGILQVLEPRVPEDARANCPSFANAAVWNTLRLITRISNESERETASELTAPAERIAIYGLLDLLALEAIYPELSAGVGIPIERRVKPVLLQRRLQKHGGNKEQLSLVIHTLAEVRKKGNRLSEVLSRRCFVDILAGTGELSFSPEISEDIRLRWREQWSSILHDTTTLTLLSTLLMLLHPKAPGWFRTEISQTLSRLPVEREHGVRGVIELFLGAPGDEAGSAASIQALSRAAQLLGSVPATMTPSAYFKAVGIQLMDLLHVSDGGLVRASAYIVAEFLSKRGRLEAAITEHITDKLLQAFRPVVVEVAKQKKRPLISIIDEEEGLQAEPSPCIVSEVNLSLALRDIATICTSNPSPVVPMKLIEPILSSLWGLYVYSKAGKKVGLWTEIPRSLILGWLRDSTGLSSTNKNGTVLLLKDITFTGGPNWSYATSQDGGVEIRYRAEDATFSMEDINLRISEYVALLKELGDQIISETFIHVFREWVRHVSTEGGSEGEQRPEQILANLQLLQLLLADHSESLAKKPGDMLQVVKEVLDGYVASRSVPGATGIQSGTPTLASLGQIVKEEPELFKTEQPQENDDDDFAAESGIENVVVLSLTLLSALISSPETSFSESDQRLLSTVRPALEEISRQIDTPGLSALALNILSIVSVAVAVPGESEANDEIERDRQAYKTALTYLTDPLVPVRAHGLSNLRSLVAASSPIIDVPSTLQLLVSMLADADSFVYLNVIKTLQTLGDKHPKLVLRQLIIIYVDEPQRLSLDERLRVGEAIIRTIQRQGGAFVEESARLVGESMLGVVSRRKGRADKPARRGKKLAPKREKVEEEDIMADLPLLDDEGNEISGRKLEEIEHSQRIVDNWKPEGAEDYRLRCSALSILSIALETNARGLTTRIVGEAIEVALSILQLERAPEAGVLRRAALVVLGEAVKGGLAVSRVKDIKRVVDWVHMGDNDGLVREMSADVGRLVDEECGGFTGETQAGRGLVQGVAGIERLALK